MTVRFVDLARLHASIRDELDAAIAGVIDAGMFVGGDPVRRFEAAFGSAHGLPPGASCGSGTDALVLALVALGIGPGDEVVVPAMTFIATAEAVVHAGSTPVLADVDPVTLMLTPETVAAVRSERTRAVLPVHLYGHVVPLDAIDAWRAEGLRVVEDAAQAHLASWQGRSVGTAGDATCFSFYPGKNLGALGDGGMVLAQDEALVERVRMLRDHGRSEKYVHTDIGWCSRLDTIQAALLSAKLEHLPEWTQRRRAAAEQYADRLGSLLVPWEDGAVHHLMVARVPAERRDAVRESLTAAGVETGIHYPVALSEQPALGSSATSCPVSERASAEVLSLPMDPFVDDAAVEQVCTALEAALA